MNKLTGSALAAAAALMMTSGFATSAFASDAATVHCTGVNSCKGTSECSTAKNSCKGQNTCKGVGWVSLTQAECDAAQAKAKHEEAK